MSYRAAKEPLPLHRRARDCRIAIQRPASVTQGANRADQVENPRVTMRQRRIEAYSEGRE